MAKTAATVKKYVLKRSMHLGYIRESFRAATIIEHDEEGDFLKIEGRKFDNTKDLQILLNHEWVVPYSKQAIEQFESEETPVVSREDEEAPEIRSMKVVKSDADLMTEEIDISHTVNRPEERAPKKASKELEVIRGDETPEERVQRLQRTVPKMPVVQDDSLGYGDSKARSLNSGTVEVKTAEEHETLRKQALEKQIKSEEQPKKKRGRPKGSKNQSKPIRKAKKLKLDDTDEFADATEEL